MLRDSDFHRWLTISLLFVLLGSRPLSAAPPAVKHLFPSGGNPGESVPLTLIGQSETEGLHAWTSRDDVTVRTEESSLVAEIADDASPGVCWIRFFNEEGASSLRPFLIGTVPEILEVEPNDSLETAQELESTHQLINGRLDKNSDVDTFAVSLEAGQVCVINLEANRTLGSPMDGLLQIVGSHGFVLTQNDDEIGLDPQLVFEVPESGRYFIRVFAFPAATNSSIRLANGEDYVYRLTVTTEGWIDHALPLAIERETRPEIRWFGWNLPGETASPLADETDPTQPVLLQSPHVANTLPIAVVNHPCVVEQDVVSDQQPQLLEFPVTVSGRISEPREVDSYRFEATQGQNLHISVESRSLGYALDPVIRLFDYEGKLIRNVDDSTRDVFDPEFSWTASADGTYRIEVTDLHGNGGMRFAYRLTVRPQEPEYSLQLATDRFILPSDKPLEIPVTVNRVHGFEEEIEILVEGLPEGVSTSVVKSLPEGDSAKSVTLTLELQESVKFQGPVRIVGRTSAEGDSRHVAAASIEGLSATTESIWLTVATSEEPPGDEE